METRSKKRNRRNIRGNILIKITPSVTDVIDFTQFCTINDPSGKVMFHIPYNYFHVWRMQGQQEILKEVMTLINKGKDLASIKEYIDAKLE